MRINKSFANMSNPLQTYNIIFAFPSLTNNLHVQVRFAGDNTHLQLIICKYVLQTYEL